VTTTILSNYASELRGIDLQALRDFALEAPWEWRKVLEALTDLAESVGGLDGEDLAELGAENERLAKEAEELREKVEELEDKGGFSRLKAAAVLALDEIRAAALTLSPALAPSQEVMDRLEAALEKLEKVVDDV
jgi:predicted RNase H-like nuclease (RuvC/YqgF family)